VRHFVIYVPDTDRLVKCEFYLDHSEVVVNDALAIGFRADGHLIGTSTPCELDIGHDPVAEVARLIDISRATSEFIIRHFLIELRGGTVDKAIEDFHLATLPLLGDLKKIHPALSVPSSFERRLHDALSAPNPRLGAARFWAEESVGAQASSAFMSSLVVNGQLSSNRAAWLGLVPTTLRHELVDSPLVSTPYLRPLASWRDVLSDLEPRARVEFVRHAMSESKSISVLASAYTLGLKAHGRDHVRAFNDLVADVLRCGVGRPGSFAMFLIAKGIAGEKASLLSTRQDCVVAASTLENCLNNPCQRYKEGILSGKTVVLAVGENWDKAAIAIDPRTERIVEAKGRKNVPLPTDVDLALRELQRQWNQYKKRGSQHVRTSESPNGTSVVSTGPAPILPAPQPARA